MTEELARAVRTESAEALRYWFGVGVKAVWNWRRWAGVSSTATTPGSKAAHGTASRAGAEAMKAKEWTEEELDARSALSRRLGLKPDRWRGRRWTAEQEARLGTAPDAVLAGRFGRTERAVRVRRGKLGVPRFTGQL